MNVKRMCRIALMAAMMVAAKEAMAWLPNGEFVTVIVTVGTLVFGWEMLLTTIVFSALEILIYGLGLWTIMYLYVWNILVILVMMLKPLFKKKRFPWVILMGMYGLSFGAMCAIPYLFMGFGTAVAWWLSGLWFDFMHFGWNLIFGWFAFNPLLKIMSKAEELAVERS